MKKKVLFCDMNPANMDIPIYPLGICLLAGIALNVGWEVDIEDFSKICDEDKVDALRDKFNKVDLVAVSIRNLDNTEGNNPISFIHRIYNTLYYLAKNFKQKVVIGGSGFSIMPERIMDEFGFLYGISGRGGSVFSELLSHLNKGNTIKSYFNTRVLSAGSEKIYEYEKLEYIWNAVKVLYDDNRKLGFDTHIGCGGSCVYCTYPYITARREEYRDEKEIEQFIRDANTYNIKKLQIVDDVFNNNLSFAKRVCNAIGKANNAIELSCYLTPNIDKEFVCALKKAGFREVIMGIDSLVDEVLIELGKSYTQEDILKATELLRDENIEVVYTLIIGSRYENRHTLEELKEKLKKHIPNRVTVQYGIRVYPNTSIYRLRQDMEKFDLLYPCYDTSDSIKKKEFEEFKTEIGKSIKERKML